MDVWNFYFTFNKKSLKNIKVKKTNYKIRSGQRYSNDNYGRVKRVGASNNDNALKYGD